MTAPFVASNGYTVDWREESDYYMTVTGKGKALGLSEYVTSPVLRALIEFAEHRDTYPEERARPVADEEVEVALAAWFRAEHLDLRPGDPDEHVDHVVASQMRSTKPGVQRVRKAVRAALEAARGAR